MRSAALERPHALPLLQQKILQGTEQERAQPPSLLIGPAQRVVLKQMLEKTLSDVLRVSRRIAATTEECVKRWPVNFAKSGERFPRPLIRLPPARLQHDGPMRRLERRTTLLERSWNRFRRLVSISFRKHFTIKNRLA